MDWRKLLTVERCTQQNESWIQLRKSWKNQQEKQIFVSLFGIKENESCFWTRKRDNIKTEKTCLIMFVSQEKENCIQPSGTSVQREKKKKGRKKKKKNDVHEQIWRANETQKPKRHTCQILTSKQIFLHFPGKTKFRKPTYKNHPNNTTNFLSKQTHIKKKFQEEFTSKKTTRKPKLTVPTQERTTLAINFPPPSHWKHSKHFWVPKQK